MKLKQDVYVEKEFKLSFENFKNGFLHSVGRLGVPCSVCDNSTETIGHQSSRQVEPTFCKELKPEYKFDRIYDFISTKLRFSNPQNETQTLEASVEVHVCLKGILVQVSHRGSESNPRPWIGLQVQVFLLSKGKSEPINEMSVECSQLSEGEKSLFKMSSWNHLKVLCKRGTMIVTTKLRFYFPWITPLTEFNRKTINNPDENVQIICDSGIVLTCSKKDLCKNSDVFFTMFSVTMRESKENVVSLSGFEPATLKFLVRYLQNGHLDPDLNLCDFSELLRISDMYNFHELKLICESQMLRLISQEDASLSALIGHHCNAHLLLAGSLDFMNRKGVNYRQVSEENQELLKSLIKDEF